MNVAPIILFVYNRLSHTQQTVEALKANTLAGRSQLIIYADAAKNPNAQQDVASVRAYLKTITGFKSVTILERAQNWGLANSIIDGVTEVVNQYGRVIVLEDDLVTSTDFLTYMNHSLDLYQDDENIASIHGYIYPIEGLPDTFFIKGADCWGWATWKRAWQNFEPDGEALLTQVKQRKLQRDVNFNHSYDYIQMLEMQIDGQISSWAVRWYIATFLKGMLTLYPGKSLVHNVGNDNSGTHSDTTSHYDTQLGKFEPSEKIQTEENPQARKKMELFFKSLKKNYFERIVSRMRKLL
ncbi:MAG: glycosyltransferase [Alphaproteobacteria bacterium]|nr:glycosyltransferase [Alphaproteobacteria bacterium]